MRTFCCASLFTVLVATAFPHAQQQPPSQPPDDQQEQDQPGGRGGAQRDPQPRPYDRVITRDAKSDEGVFTIHRIRDRVYYEIPNMRPADQYRVTVWAYERRKFF